MPSARRPKPTDNDPAVEDEKRRLKEMLNAGIESLRAGRIVNADEMQRRIDQVFRERARAKAAKKRSR